MKRLGALSFALLAVSAWAANPPWALPDAPMRAVFLPGEGPTIPEAGWLLAVPELGVTSASLADVLVTDAKGVQLPVAKIARMEGHQVLLLVPAMAGGSEVMVYFGGNRARRDLKWAPKLSLLAETRRMPAGTKMDSWSDLDMAWKSARESDGAGFVPQISHGENPFGESADFLSRFTGLLKAAEKKVTLYTISSDASFVSVNGKAEIGWPGKHSARANQNEVRRAEVANPGGMIAIEYLHAKEGGGQATMLLGWMKGAKFEAIPASAWVHPGRGELVRLEHVNGWPVARPEAGIGSYIGYAGHWLYETRCILKGGLPAGWKARWEWSDGAVFEGETCARVLVGPAPVRVFVRLSDGQKQTSGAMRIEFNGTPRQASIEKDGDVARYLSLIEKEEPARLSPATLAGHLALASEFGTDQLLGRYGAAWVARSNNQSDPMWLAGQLARVRALAQTNPQAAIGELHRFDIQTRKKFPQLATLEMDVLVFGMKSPEALQLAQRISFEQPNSENQRLAKIRVGDLYRLLGRVKEARAQYESVQRTIDTKEESRGKKLPAMDRAFSITITGFIDQGERKAAEAKLAEWETEHPMAKYDSDFLLLRGRVLMMFGRWNEALQEMDSFRTLNPDSPFQIIADFHRAHALAGLGRKEEAKKIWADIARNFPKHELAPEAGRLSGATGQL